MKERYAVAVAALFSGFPLRPTDEMEYLVIDKQRNYPVCWCVDRNLASKIATALNRQYRAGAERRAAQKAHA